jgi:hypothetical protein
MRLEFGGLWRHRDFLKLWSAHATSLFGTQLAALAAGVLGELIGLRATLAVAACGMILPFLRLFFSPVRNFDEQLNEN